MNTIKGLDGILMSSILQVISIFVSAGISLVIVYYLVKIYQVVTHNTNKKDL